MRSMSSFFSLALLALTACGGGGSAAAPGPGSGAPEDVVVRDLGNERDVGLSWAIAPSEQAISGVIIERQAASGTGWTDLGTLEAAPTESTAVDSPGPGRYRYRVAFAKGAETSEYSAWSSVSVALGWTQFSPSVDSRLIYVSSSSGTDLNDGLSEATAVRTFARADQLLRSGFPDWLLLKRGDRFTETMSLWSGRSVAEPMVMGAYGPGVTRPLVEPGEQAGFQRISGGGRGNCTHIALVGIHFRAPSEGSPQPGVSIVVNAGEDILVEDCLIEGFKLGVSIIGYPDMGGLANVRIRRCVVSDCAEMSGAGHSQGAYFDGVTALLVEGCCFDHNGWRTLQVAPPTIFNHNIYIQSNCGPAILRHNIVARAASHGAQVRPGGVVEDNLFVQNSLALFVAVNPSIVRRNVVLEGKDISATAPRRFGIETIDCLDALVEDNIVAHAQPGATPSGPGLHAATSSVDPLTYRANFRNNVVYDWNGPSFRASSEEQSLYTFVSVASNVFEYRGVPGRHVIEHVATFLDLSRFSFSGNRYVSAGGVDPEFRIGTSILSLPQWISVSGESDAVAREHAFVDPTRTVGTYNATLGGPDSLEAFLAEARRQSRAFWREEYTAGAVNAYIREGFKSTE